MSKIAVLGMGAMGSRMATSLLKAGHQVVVWNRTMEKANALKKAGATVAETPRTAVVDADFVISMVRDDVASKQVWLDPETGALKGLAKNAIAIESSTLTVSWIEELATHFQSQNRAFLDAPVAGTRPQAEQAKLIYFVGGELDSFTKAKPILETMGNTVNFMGVVGSGMTIKLAINALFAIQVAAVGELIGLFQSCGFDEAKAVEVITATPICSPAVKIAVEAMVKRQFNPLFPIELVEKDLDYASQTAKTNQCNLPLVAATQDIYKKVIKQGSGNDNINSVVRLYNRTKLNENKSS